MRSSLVALALVLVACGGDDTSSVPDASGDDASVDVSSSQDGTTSDTSPPADVFVPSDAASDVAGKFVLTSSAYAEGGAIPVANSCKGVNESPPLAWSGAPGATMSYALTFVDKSNNLVHAAMYDIPANVSSLAAAIPNVATPPTPAGMKQVKAYDNATFGYKGPCPGSVHTYTFTLYAVDVAALPGVTTNSSRAQVITALTGHTLATATLTGTFTP